MNDRDKQKDKQSSDETGSDKAFVGTSKDKDTSEANLSEDTAGETDLANQGQGALESRAGNEDVETGKSTTRDAVLDDGSQA
jgi:hypothetical protein